MEQDKINGIAEHHFNQYQPSMPRFSIYEIQDYLRRYNKKERKTHTIKYHKIIWFKKGNGKHFVDYKSYDVISNTIFFINKNQTHYFDRNNDYQGILIYFNDEFLFQNGEPNFIAKYDLFNGVQGRPTCSVSKDYTFILDEYMSLIKIELSSSGCSEEILKTYLKVFLTQIQYLRNKYEKIDGQTIDHDKNQLKLLQFVNLIEDYYKKDLTVSEYAQLLKVSSRTLSYLTSKLINKSPSQLIHERIILEAQTLLYNTDFNIEKVATRLGFKESSYFVKYFKTHTGISPSDFRKY